MLKSIELDQSNPAAYLLIFRFEIGSFSISINKNMSLHSVLLSLISLTEEMKKHVRVN
jgi:hypothetical protein